MRSSCSGTPRIGTHYRDRRKSAGARHGKLDLPQLGQQMPPVGTIAPVGLIERGHPSQVLIDDLIHLATKNDGNRLAAKTAIAFTPIPDLAPACPSPDRKPSLSCGLSQAVALGVLL